MARKYRTSELSDMEWSLPQGSGGGRAAAATGRGAIRRHRWAVAHVPDAPSSTTRSTGSGTSCAFHSAEPKYSKRSHGADRLAKKVLWGSALGPEECANNASSGRARSQMKRLVAPTSA